MAPKKKRKMKKKHLTEVNSSLFVVDISFLEIGNRYEKEEAAAKEEETLT